MSSAQELPRLRMSYLQKHLINNNPEDLKLFDGEA
jgi:hypothetical protein